MSELCGWTPFRAAWQAGDMFVDWCHLDAKRFTEPFFYETISRVIGHPFNQAFRPRTRADDLCDLPSGLKPSGFIFHMARCGSTLCAQALAADPANIVASEAVPIRAVLQVPLYVSLPPERVDAWLAGIVNALAQPRLAGETRFFVKFMAADILDIGRITRVFPDVPWVFLYRDPLEILASQHALGGADTLPGQISADLLGLTMDAIAPMSPIAYQCHVMAALGRSALAARRGGRGLILPYRDLPEALWDRLPAHFGLPLDAAGRARIQAVAGRDAKRPGATFRPDSAEKREAASAWAAEAETIVGPVIAALDACCAMVTHGA